MKPQVVIIAFAFTLSAPLVLAQQTDTLAADAAEPASPMMQRMEEMQSLMEKMSETNAPAERHKLVEEHREKMRDAMATMRGMRMGMNMGAGQGMGQPQAKGMMGAMHGGGHDMMPMMQRMEKMQAHLDKIRQATDPAERQKLMTEHRLKMQDTMSMMRGMGMGAGQGMRGMGNRQGSGQDMMMTGLLAAYQQMDKRLDAMQMLLEQALQR